jgi:hypothetical protein
MNGFLKHGFDINDLLMHVVRVKLNPPCICCKPPQLEGFAPAPNGARAHDGEAAEEVSRFIRKCAVETDPLADLTPEQLQELDREVDHIERDHGYDFMRRCHAEDLSFDEACERIKQDQSDAGTGRVGSMSTSSNALGGRPRHPLRRMVLITQNATRTLMY